MKVKKLMVSTMVIALLAGPVINMDTTFAKEQKVTQSQNSKSKGQMVTQNQNSKIKELTTQEVVQLSSNLAQISSYVQAGGSYKEGEYKTFTYKETVYRYLSPSIDTRKELLGYLKGALTHNAAVQFIKNKGIIEYKGKMAQVEADGGSLLQWSKASAEFVKEVNKTKFYRLSVPVGDTGKKSVYIVEFQHVNNKIGWRISKMPYLDLDIPFNINPVQIFFNNIVKNPAIAEKQFIDPSSFPFDDFKKGVKKVELTELKELNRTESQVEYVAKVNVTLESNYKGSLNKGVNQFYFLIQPVDEMEFKIVSYGTGPHLIK